MSEVQPTPELDDLFIALHDKTKSVSAIRNEIIKKLHSSVGMYDLGDTNPRSLEVKLAAIKTLDDLLKSEESSATSLIKTQLLRKETESNTDVKAATVEMLKAIKIKQTNIREPIEAPADIMDTIERVASSCDNITEDELRIDE